MQYVLTFFPLVACDGDVCESPVCWFWFWYELCWADRPALALMPCGGYPTPDPLACRVLGDACTFRYWQSRSSFLFCRTIAKRVAPNPIAMSAAKIAMLKGTERGCTVDDDSIENDRMRTYLGAIQNYGDLRNAEWATFQTSIVYSHFKLCCLGM